MTSNQAPKGKSRRGGGLRALAATLPKVTARAYGRRGFAEGGLAADWTSVVGRDIARRCQPQRLSFARSGPREGGTLTLRVDSGFALEMQHLEPLLIERLNSYFGYRAVAALTLRQGPLRHKPARAKPETAPLSAEEETRLQERLAAVEDPEVRAALGRLGRSVRQSRGKRRADVRKP